MKQAVTRSLTVFAAGLSVAASGLALPASAAPASGQTSRPNVSHQGVATAVDLPVSPDAICAQNNNPPTGNGIGAQDFETPFDAYDSQGAADFQLSSSCQVSTVDVAGLFSTSGPAIAITISFHPSAPSSPPQCTTTQAGPGPNFSVSVSGCTLTPGTYWLVVQVRQDFNPNGQWYWATTATRLLANDQWQNPGGGFGVCSTWDTVDVCIGIAEDYLFSVNGVAGDDGRLRNLTKDGSTVSAGNAACPDQPYYLYSGGKSDSYASPADYAYPSPNLVDYIPTGRTIVDYDVAETDDFFGDSFNLQNTRGVCYALIKFRAKVSNGSLAKNDGLVLGHVGNGGTPFDVVASVGNPALFTGIQSYALDATGLSLLSQQTGYFLGKTPDQSILDLYLQDDTMIDFFKLYVWYGPNCSQDGIC